MAFIREKKEEKTGYQEVSPFNAFIDLKCDFVMVYGTDPQVHKRISEYKTKGYVVHLMTGVAWGEYQDYLEGDYDGMNHWDEAQMDQTGTPVIHGESIPYMVPTLSYCDYLIEKLKSVIDEGVEAIHLEEPEFWQHSGYSLAFKREYLNYYKEEWRPQHLSCDDLYKTSKLKSYLYARALDKIAASLKDYSVRKYNRLLRFYVPTHSLLNYTQWKIISPEGLLIDMQYIDGYIAQIWTGTSREPNVFNNIKKERTFETAFLEYGIMQDLVRGTGRHMWFLNDPIEDNPSYTWDNYQHHYEKTLIASLLHSEISHYEICPWPNRVFNRKLPILPIEKQEELNIKPSYIPEHYNTFLNNIFNTLGNMESISPVYEQSHFKAAIFLADSAMFQRNLPEHLLSDSKLAAAIDLTFSDFYGLTLPLLKNGIPLGCAQLDNIVRYANYLDAYDVLILSYDFLKPEKSDINFALARYVMDGGMLLFVGDQTEPYHQINNWWNSGKKTYLSPTHHLFELLNIKNLTENQIQKRGKGLFAYYHKKPMEIAMSMSESQSYIQFFQSALEMKGYKWQMSNYIQLKRGPYVIASCMDESLSGNQPLVMEGIFADILNNQFEIITQKIIHPNEVALLYDVSKAQNGDVIGSTLRVNAVNQFDAYYEIELTGKKDVYVSFRCKVKSKPSHVTFKNSINPLIFDYNDLSKTILINFKNRQEVNTLMIHFS